MKIFILRAHDEPYLNFTEDNKNDFGLEIHVSKCMPIVGAYDVLIATHKAADGCVTQPVESYFKDCIIVYSDHYELRQFEQIQLCKYAIHHELVNLAKIIDFASFIYGVLFSLSSDVTDIRRAAKTGAKFGVHQVSSVVN